MEQLDKSLVEHLIAAGTKEGKPDILDAYFLKDLVEVHCYLNMTYDPKPNEIAALLQFADPLAVAQECWEKRETENDFPICHLLNEIKAYDRFPLADSMDYSQEQMVAVLNVVLDQNMDEYRTSLLSMDKEEIISKSAETARRQEAYTFMKEDFRFERGDAETLLRMEDPLGFVADQWPVEFTELFNMDELISEAIESAGKAQVVQREAEQPEEPAFQGKSPIEALNTLLDKNMADFDAELVGMDEAEIAELQEVTTTRSIYNFIRNEYEGDFEPYVAEFLLRMENPLQFIVEQYPYITETVDRLISEEAKDTGKGSLPQPGHDDGEAAGKKPSVLEQIKANKQEIHQQPTQERPRGSEAR